MRAALSMVCVCAHGRQPGVISGCQGMNVLLIIRMQTGVLLCSHEHKVVAMYMRWLAAYWRKPTALCQHVVLLHQVHDGRIRRHSQHGGPELP